MSLAIIAIIAIIAIAICLVGTRIATAIFSLVDDDEDAPEAMTGDDYRHNDAAE